MTTRPRAILAIALLTTLTGCGTAAAPGAATRQPAMLAALADDKADAARPKPPTGNPEPIRQGLAARQSARIADRALQRYLGLVRQWERAWTDEEKDRIEQRMLDELHLALRDVQREASAHGKDHQDRRAYDLAGDGLDRYEQLYREWQSAWGERERRRLANAMITTMMYALRDVRDNG